MRGSSIERGRGSPRRLGSLERRTMMRLGTDVDFNFNFTIDFSTSLTFTLQHVRISSRDEENLKFYRNFWTCVNK